MRSLLVAILCFIATQIALAQEEKENKEFKITFLDRNTITFNGTIGSSPEISRLLVKEKLLLKTAEKFTEDGLLAKESYKFREIKKSEKTVGITFELFLDEKLDIQKFHALIQKLPPDWTKNLPEGCQEKIESGILLLKTYALLPLQLQWKGSIKISAHLPGEERDQGGGEIRLEVKITCK